MSLTELEVLLERLNGFPSPKPKLEQYTTPSWLAARILHTAEIRDDLSDPVVDLGCGTGVFAVGAASMGYRSIGVDVDAEALEIASEDAGNLLGCEAPDWITADVDHLPLDTSGGSVVMNPPFGAQHRGADRKFLDKASSLSSVTYSIHNSGSMEFVESYVRDLEPEGRVTDVFEASIYLERRFDFHEKDREEVDVEVHRIEFRR
ncbi:MAG: METTL5 family protein [Halobacteria archaeon]